jgi:hypothetical protein
MAIQIRKLSGEEASRVFPKRSQMDLSEYLDALQQLAPGDAAEFKLNGLSSRAAKRRFGQAAGQLGYRMKWSRAGASDVLFFQVVTGKRAAMGNGRRRGAQSQPKEARQTRRVSVAPAAAVSQTAGPPMRRGRRRATPAA